MMNKERWEHKLSQTLGSLCSNKDFFRLPSGLLDHDRTEKAQTVSTSCCPIQILRKLF